MEDIIKVLDALKNRVPWHVMRKILISNNLPTGQGWSQSIDKILSHFENDTDKLPEATVLFKTFKDLVLTGEKSLRLYEIDPHKIDNAISICKQCTITKSIFSIKYPYPVTKEELLDTDDIPHLVEIIDTEHGVILVFCTKRFFTEKVPLKPKDLGISSDRFTGFDEIIGVRHTTDQMYDVVVFDKRSNYVEIRIDSTHSMTTDELEVAFKVIRNEVNHILNNSSPENATELEKPVNLFRLVDSFYSSKEGRICELAFETDTASIKHEKMRRKSLDLREEKYHKAGSAAVDHITPYRLGICWSLDMSNNIKVHPELFLPGNVRMLNNPKIQLDGASIRNCSSSQDYEYVISRIKTHLNQNGK
ncbi:MAG: hypothetical protein JAY74_23695 [Candidatus Thiodiazotropha taylori]|nr:hypothetical protein [Candidatus Thiodiazotropha taylori]